MATAFFPAERSPADLTLLNTDNVCVRVSSQPATRPRLPAKMIGMHKRPDCCMISSHGICRHHIGCQGKLGPGLVTVLTQATCQLAFSTTVIAWLVGISGCVSFFIGSKVECQSKPSGCMTFGGASRSFSERPRGAGFTPIIDADTKWAVKKKNKKIPTKTQEIVHLVGTYSAPGCTRRACPAGSRRQLHSALERLYHSASRAQTHSVRSVTASECLCSSSH